MKNKIFLVLALLALVGVVNAAPIDDAITVALDNLFRLAKPVEKAPVLIDSKGCLWGLHEQDGRVITIQILDGDHKPACRQR